MSRYPHQLSGGMQQRVVIAMALAKDPALLILDEPTTGLDATVEAEVLDLVVAASRPSCDTSVLFISHNLGVISKMCDRVGVLYAGRLVEEGPVETVLQDPRHPYTVGLLRCIPRGGVRKDHGRLDTIPGLPAEPRRGDRRVRVRRPLRARRRALPQRGAAADRRRGRPREPLLVPRPRASTSRARRLRISSCRRSTEAGRRSSRSTELGEGLPAARDTTSMRSRRSARRSGRARRSGLVGESGSGKTTLARTLLGHRPADRRSGRRSRAGSFRPATRSARATSSRAPDRLPEPRLGTQPAPLGAPHPAALAQEARRD